MSRANNLLSASYQLYQHIGTNETVLRTLSYGLPEALLAYVQTVTPTTHFGFPRTSFQKPLMCRGRAAGAQPKVLAGELETVLSSRSERVMPAFLRWLYRISGYVPTAAKYNVVGIVGLLNDYPNPDDLRLFMNAYRDDATSATYNCRTRQRQRVRLEQPRNGTERRPPVCRGHGVSRPRIYSTASVLPWAILSSIGSTSCSVG